MAVGPTAIPERPLTGSQKYSFVRCLDRGTFGCVQLAIDLTSGEQVAIKCIERGAGVTKYLHREIMNHRRLMHPHIVQLREVFLTATHLCIVMEYAAGGNLYHLVSASRGLSEADARWYFQQLIFAVDYCHRLGVCSRDIKLENTLLAGPNRPLIKLCDFGYSKDVSRQSAAASKVGTPAYLAPEVVQARAGRTYDGKAADLWSCGVLLYVMLTARYPFGRPEGEKGGDNSQAVHAMLHRICRGAFWLPEGVRASAPCRDLLGRLLTVAPEQRATAAEVQAHPWFRHDLPEGVAAMNHALLARQAIEEAETDALLAAAAVGPAPSRGQL